MTTTIAKRITEIIEICSGGIDPAHGATDPGKLAELVSSMEAHGWQGAPIVVDGESALTGSHRLAAAREAGIDVPRVQISDLCDLFGADWDAHREDCGGDLYEAAAAVDEILPGEVVDYLGLDMH